MYVSGERDPGRFPMSALGLHTCPPTREHTETYKNMNLLTQCQAHGEHSVNVGSRSVIRTVTGEAGWAVVGSMTLGTGVQGSLWGWGPKVVGLDQVGLGLE